MAPKSDRRKYPGLNLLREAIGAAVPQWARKGALTPKHLAPLAGVNYSTVRQLLNGARYFETDTPLNRLMAENLSFTTGVDPNFRTTQSEFIHDIFGEKYTPETFLKWTKDSPIEEALFLPSKGLRKGAHPIEVPPLSERMRQVTGKLTDAIFEQAKKRGSRFECMAHRLLKQKLQEVASDLGVLDEVEATGLSDFVMGIDADFWLNLGALSVVIEENSWRRNAPALTLVAHREDNGPHLVPPDLPANERKRLKKFLKNQLRPSLRAGNVGSRVVKPSIITLLK